MDKNLPRVYANPINKEIHNNKEVYYSRDEKHISRSVSTQDISKKINEIFSNVHHVYKSNVTITTDKGTFNTIIVGKTSDYLLTLNGEKIALNSIKDIERI